MAHWCAPRQLAASPPRLLQLPGRCACRAAGGRGGGARARRVGEPRPRAGVFRPPVEGGLQPDEAPRWIRPCCCLRLKVSLFLVSIKVTNFYFLTADYSFAGDYGGNRSMMGSDDIMYEVDLTNLGAASYYVTGQTRWGVSNVGKFNEAPNGSYIFYSSQQFQNAQDSELFQIARMSPSSLRYYGLGLENGNYTVVLQFAVFAYRDTQTWESTARRVLDIYVQGDPKEKNFDVRKMAGGKSFTAVVAFLLKVTTDR